MRVLITGANGFIGANLIRRLCQDKHEVHCLIRKQSDLWRLASIPDQLTLHVTDLTSAKAVEAVFGQIKPEWVLHLATARSAANDFGTYFNGNVVVAANLISACVNHRPSRIVILGSSLEYGAHRHPLYESMPASPTTFHGTTKLCATQLFLQAQRSFELPVTILRLFSVYGPWEQATRLIPYALLAALDGRSIRLTPPGIRRDYVYVNDVVDATMITLGNLFAIGEIINIGSGIQTSNEQVISTIAEITGKSLPILDFDYPRHETDTDYWVADMNKCQAILGWLPPTSLACGIATYLEWLVHYRQNMPHV